MASAIVRTELLRVGLRIGEAHLVAAERLLSGVSTVSVTRARLDRAGRLSPAPLRSLDALHLATTLELRDELDAFVGYGTRLLEAARQHHLTTVSPA